MKICVWISWVLLAGLYFVGPLRDSDLWWHITVGRWILANGTVPSVDLWNLYSQGEPWKAYSWSNEVLFAFFDRHWGYAGLMFLKICLSVVMSFSLFYCLGKISRDWFFGGLLGFLVMAAGFGQFCLRPQSFVWIYFTWILYLLFQVQEQGFRARHGLGFFIVMSLWANTHITTLLGIGAVVAWLTAVDLSEDLKIKKIYGQRGLLPSLLCCLAGTFVTPYWGGEWLTLLDKAGHPLTYSSISEFQPANIMNYSSAILLFTSFLLLVILHFRPSVIELPKLAVWGVYLLLALSFVKFMPFAVIITCVWLALGWKDETGKLSGLSHLFEACERLRKGVLFLPRPVLSLLLLILALFSIRPAWQMQLDAQGIPVSSVDYIMENELPHPILNEFGHGGYLMYRFSDAAGNLERKVVLDGRTNINSPELFEKHLKSLRGQHGWQDYIDMVNPGTILWRTESPFVSLLNCSPEWVQVFSEGSKGSGHTVFVRAAVF